jgi:hypothetical protein
VSLVWCLLRCLYRLYVLGSMVWCLLRCLYRLYVLGSMVWCLLHCLYRLYVLGSMVWCPLRCLYKTHVWFDFTLTCLFYLCYLCLLCIVLSNHILTVWVTLRVSYRKQEMLTLHEFIIKGFGGVRVPHLFIILVCVVLLCVFTF